MYKVQILLRITQKIYLQLRLSKLYTTLIENKNLTWIVKNYRRIRLSSKIKLMQIYINGNLKQLDSENVTISALVVTLNLTGKRLAIEQNGEIVPRSQFDTVNLRDGDKLEIVGAVGGGWVIWKIIWMTN